jgi:hypothetical protein
MRDVHVSRRSLPIRSRSAAPAVDAAAPREAPPAIAPAVQERKVVACCLACDPGPTRSAYALLVAYADGVIAVEHVWYVEHTRVWLWAVLRTFILPAGGFFAVETIEGEIYHGRSAAQVLQTKKVEGRIQEAAEVVEVMPVEIEATSWRRTITKAKGWMTNAEVTCVVEGIYRSATGELELPAMDDVAREHIYDAILCGMIAIVWRLKSSFALPKHVMEALLLVQMREESHRRAKKQAKALGIKMPRRAPRKLTREQRQRATVKAAATRAEKKKRST